MTLLERLRKAVAPRYTVDREIARGGMGIVFAGQDARLDRPVAFKVLMPELASEEFSRRFLHEAQMMAQVRHPNVVVVHDSGEREGLSFFVMDYIEGETLAQRLARGPLDADAARDLGRDILGALAAVHRHGIVHRDVKPANVFLTEHGALLSDFGIAHREWGDTPTDPGRLIGTPRYWAPEQSDGLEVTRATDIYSAGVVLYQAWTGRDWPLRQEPPTGDWSQVPLSAKRALAKALAPRPEDRWQAAGDFAAALKGRWTGVRPGHVIVGAVAALIAVLWTVRGPVPEPRALPPADLTIVPFDGGDSVALGHNLARQVGFRLEWWPKWQSRATSEAFAWWDSVAATKRERDAARMLNTRFVVHGGIIPRDDDVAARVEILDSSGRVFETADVPRQGRNPLDWSGAIADSLVRKLFPAQLEPYREVTAGGAWSREAVREMIAGDDAFHRDDWVAALEHYDRALEIDPGLAQAAWMRTVLLRWQRRPFEAELHRLYLTRRDALPELYRELTSAQLEPDLRLRFQRFDSIVRAFPRRWIATFIYADELFHRGPLIGIPLDRALRLMSESSSGNAPPSPATVYDHTGWGYIRLGRKQSADSAAKRRAEIAVGIKAGGDRAQLLRLAWYARFAPVRATVGLHVLLWTADAAKIDAIGQYMRLGLSFDIPDLQLAIAEELGRPSRSDSLRASAHAGRALALVALGRGHAALAALDTAAMLFGTPEAQFQTAEWRVVFPALGLPIADSAERDGARGELLVAAATTRHRARASWTLALDALARGDSAETSRWARRLAGTQGPGDLDARPLATILDATRLATVGRADSALALTDPLIGTPDSAGTIGGPFARSALHLSRGRWLAELGRSAAADSALLWYEASDIPGWAQGEPSGGEIDGVMSVLARLLRSEVATARGAVVTACEHVGRVRELWAKSDPAFAALRLRADSVARHCPK